MTILNQALVCMSPVLGNSIYFLNFECPRLGYGFLSIILVLEKSNLSPSKVLEFCTLSLLRSLVTDVAWSVRLSVGHNHELCWNDWTDQDVVWSVDSGGPRELRIRWGAFTCRVRGSFVGDISLPIVNTLTRLTALCPGLPGWAVTRKVKPIWILLKQEIVSSSGISWAICKSAPRSRQITTPASRHSVFFTSRMPFLPPNQQRQSTEGISLPIVKYGEYPHEQI